MKNNFVYSERFYSQEENDENEYFENLKIRKKEDLDKINYEEEDENSNG